MVTKNIVLLWNFQAVIHLVFCDFGTFPGPVPIIAIFFSFFNIVTNINLHQLQACALGLNPSLWEFIFLYRKFLKKQHYRNCIGSNSKMSRFEHVLLSVLLLSWQESLLFSVGIIDNPCTGLPISTLRTYWGHSSSLQTIGTY